MSLKKSIAIILSLMMLVAMLAGCSTPAETPAEEPAETGSSEPAASGEEPAAEEPAAERTPATFHFFYSSSATTTVDPWLDTPVGQWLQEKTNVELEIEYLVGSDVRQKASLLIAAGEYPDIMTTGDASGDYFAAGAFIPLNDYIANSTNIKNCFTESQLKLMTQEDGNIYWFGSHASENSVYPSAGYYLSMDLLEKAGYTTDDIKSFADLKKVAEDITARKDELGFAAFTSAGMDSSSDWRFKTHLANLPIYFEYQDEGITSTDAIKGTYLDNYKNIWDLYINNATCEPTELAAKTADDSLNEFLAGEAVFYQNGSWEYGNVTGEGKFTDDDLAMIPIYIGVGDEANQGLCTGTENYWCVNNMASEEDIQATLDFINWCVTSEEGTTAMANEMGFVIPFKAAQESANLFVKTDAEMTAAGKTPVSWNFTTMPSEEWKNVLGTALTAYAAGTGSWDDVVTAFVDNWAAEYQLANG